MKYKLVFLRGLLCTRARDTSATWGGEVVSYVSINPGTCTRNVRANAHSFVDGTTTVCSKHTGHTDSTPLIFSPANSVPLSVTVRIAATPYARTARIN